MFQFIQNAWAQSPSKFGAVLRHLMLPLHHVVGDLLFICERSAFGTLLKYARLSISPIVRVFVLDGECPRASLDRWMNPMACQLPPTQLPPGQRRTLPKCAPEQSNTNDQSRPEKWQAHLKNRENSQVTTRKQIRKDDVYHKNLPAHGSDGRFRKSGGCR